jgi:hypothetical protein
MKLYCISCIPLAQNRMALGHPCFVGLDRTWVTVTSQAEVTVLFSKLFFSEKMSSQWDGHQTLPTTV